MKYILILLILFNFACSQKKEENVPVKPESLQIKLKPIAFDKKTKTVKVQATYINVSKSSFYLPKWFDGGQTYIRQLPKEVKKSDEMARSNNARKRMVLRGCGSKKREKEDYILLKPNQMHRKEITIDLSAFENKVLLKIGSSANSDIPELPNIWNGSIESEEIVYTIK